MEISIGNLNLSNSLAKPNNNSFPICNATKISITFFILSLIFIFIFVFIFNETFFSILNSISEQNKCVVFMIFMPLFLIVAFPFVGGYSILLLASGYIFGFIKGLSSVIFLANFSVFFSFIIIKLSNIAIFRNVSNFHPFEQLLDLLAGSKAFRVVLFSRLTPIPFGIQNCIFALSQIKTNEYLAASFLGMLPAQIFNCYLGSSFRTFEEIFSGQNSSSHYLFLLQVY